MKQFCQNLRDSAPKKSPQTNVDADKYAPLNGIVVSIDGFFLFYFIFYLEKIYLTQKKKKR